MKKLWKNRDTGEIVIAEKQPRYFEIPQMYEDDLPDDISEKFYFC